MVTFIQTNFLYTEMLNKQGNYFFLRINCSDHMKVKNHIIRLTYPQTAVQKTVPLTITPKPYLAWKLCWALDPCLTCWAARPARQHKTSVIPGVKQTLKAPFKNRLQLLIFSGSTQTLFNVSAQIQKGVAFTSSIMCKICHSS